MSSRSRLTCKFESSSPLSSKLPPIPPLLPQTCCSMVNDTFSTSSQQEVYLPRNLTVLSNALFSHHPTFSSFLTDLPEVNIYENGNFQDKRVQRLHVLLQAVSGHWEGVMARDRNTICRTSGWQNKYRQSMPTPTLSHCHPYTATQVLADDESLGGSKTVSMDRLGQTDWLDSGLTIQSSGEKTARVLLSF